VKFALVTSLLTAALFGGMLLLCWRSVDGPVRAVSWPIQRARRASGFSRVMLFGSARASALLAGFGMGVARSRS